MNIKNNIESLENGIVPVGWASIASKEVGDYSPSEILVLELAISEFVRKCLLRFQRSFVALERIGYRFAFSPPLKMVGEFEMNGTRDFLLKCELPLSIRCFYRIVEYLNCSQDGSQMFDRQTGFFYFARFLTFTMPPIESALKSRWDDDTIESDAEEEEEVNDGFFQLEEFPEVDEDAKGFFVPSNHVDPSINAKRSLHFLQWLDLQSRWCGHSRLIRAFEKGASEEFTSGLNLELLSQVFPFE